MARPQFKVTQALRRKVSIAAGAGMTHEEIALGLGISQPTLRKHFGHELSAGAYERRLEVLVAMHDAAVKGNVSAQKAYAAFTPMVTAPDPDPGPQEKPRGKKEQANVDAKTAASGTRWADILDGPARVQ